MKKIFTIISLVLFLGACQTAPIYEPTGIILPSGFTQVEAKDVILSALESPSMIRRGWMVKEIQEDKVVAILNVRTHQATIDIFFNDSSITPRLASSENLLQKNGKIHRNFNRWLSILVNEIRVNIVQKPIE